MTDKPDGERAFDDGCGGTLELWTSVDANGRHSGIGIRAHDLGDIALFYANAALAREIGQALIKMADELDAVLAARQEHVPDAAHEGLAQAAAGELVDGPGLGGNGDG